MDNYLIEREGQFDFYKMFLPRVNPNVSVDDLLADNNDGVLNGNLLEFKLHVSDLNAVLFQCIKYLSALRIKGKPVPANIIIVDLNATMAWHYHSLPYLKFIEIPYSGGASKDNSGFIGGNADTVFHYNEQLDAESLITTLKENKFIKIHIDENCIVGWASSYYKGNPTARKEDFIGDDNGKHNTIGEIRRPRYFADYIYPYEGGSNVRFNYLMDKLNDTIQKKNLGAFYTPSLYAEKAVELVRIAIARVPKDNDYIILDRCAGTGNLEAHFNEEELSHCIVSTVEYYEYKVLLELFGSRVRHIIPPNETSETFNAGLVTGADALSEEYINNPIIKEYINNQKCTVIMFENPPFSETTSIEHQKRKVGTKSSVWKDSHVVKEMKKHGIKGTALNDLGNAFIWSAFHYYLRQPTDSYIVYSPVKYWKAHHLIDKKFLKGFAFNRKHFHTTINACIMCALWTNENSSIEEMFIDAYNINKNNNLINQGSLPIKRVYSMFSRGFYDKRSFDSDEKGIIAEYNGVESMKKPQGIKPIYNDNIMGYLSVKGNNFDDPDASVHFLRIGQYDGHGFYLRKDNYLEKLPMFAASRYITYNREWTERTRIMKSADGAVHFEHDVKNGKLRQWLLKYLLFTCVEMQNHLRTFTGSDGRFYRNELCLDGTNGETIAMLDLKGLDKGEKEIGIIKQWSTVLQYAKSCKGYHKELTYGVYQIYAELNTSHKDDFGHTVYDNIELNSALTGLKQLVKSYYNEEIVPTLFEYEFLK